jgi:hypothetical protein
MKKYLRLSPHKVALVNASLPRRSDQKYIISDIILAVYAVKFNNLRSSFFQYATRKSFITGYPQKVTEFQPLRISLRPDDDKLFVAKCYPNLE